MIKKLWGRYLCWCDIHDWKFAHHFIDGEVTVNYVDRKCARCGEHQKPKTYHTQEN